MTEQTPETEATEAKTHEQCEPGGTVYCDDYEAITGITPGGDVEASTIAVTKVVKPKQN